MVDLDQMVSASLVVSKVCPFQMPILATWTSTDLVKKQGISDQLLAVQDKELLYFETSNLLHVQHSF
jgi:hypothetical protein